MAWSDNKGFKCPAMKQHEYQVYLKDHWTDTANETMTLSTKHSTLVPALADASEEVYQPHRVRAKNNYFKNKLLSCFKISSFQLAFYDSLLLSFIHICNATSWGIEWPLVAHTTHKETLSYFS